MINENSAKTFCCEDISLIENYKQALNDKTTTWHCHHRGEILPCGRYTVKDLKKFNLYYSRPANELIFLSPSDHHRLHHKYQPISEETCRKISTSHKNKGKTTMKNKTNTTSKAGSKRFIARNYSFDSQAAGVSKALKGKPQSKRHRKQIGEGVRTTNAEKAGTVIEAIKAGEDTQLKYFTTTSEAARYLGCSKQLVCQALRCEKNYSARGWVFKRVKLEDVLKKGAK